MRHGIRKPHLPRDLGAPLAACFDQPVGDVAGREGMDQRAEPLREPGLQTRMGEDEMQNLRQAFVQRLEVALEGEVIGQKELADTGGIAGAADVLQQQHVIEIVALHGRQRQARRHRHADVAAPECMALGLPLRHVERKGQRSDQLRLRYGHLCLTSADGRILGPKRQSKVTVSRAIPSALPKLSVIV